MRDELKEFYQLVLEWLETDRLLDIDFETDMGLCGNLYNWAEDAYGEALACELYDVQKRMFIEAGLDVDFPFDADIDAYLKSAREGKHGLYDNPERLNWIKEHAQ